jgi:hypothetical protein
MVRVACVPDLPLQRLQTLLGALSARGVYAEWEVTHLRTPGQLALLAAGDLDLGVFHAGMLDVDGIGTQPLYRGEALGAVLPVGDVLAGRSALRPVDLEDQALVLFPRAADPALHDRLVDVAVKAGYRFRDVQQVAGEDLRDLLFAVAQGRGVTLMPATGVRAAGELSTIVEWRPLVPAPTMPDTLIAWNSHALREAEDVLAVVRGVARDLYTG